MTLQDVLAGQSRDPNDHHHASQRRLTARWTYSATRALVTGYGNVQRVGAPASPRSAQPSPTRSHEENAEIRIPFGIDVKTQQAVSIPCSLFKHHMYVGGGSGARKTLVLAYLARMLIEHTDAAVVFADFEEDQFAANYLHDVAENHDASFRLLSGIPSTPRTTSTRWPLSRHLRSTTSSRPRATSLRHCHLTKAKAKTPIGVESISRRYCGPQRTLSQRASRTRHLPTTPNDSTQSPKKCDDKTPPSHS